MSSPDRLRELRVHVAEWGGLNATDATELLDLLENAARPERAIQDYLEPMTPDMPADRMTFVEYGDWVRLVTPWRPA